MRTNSFLLNWTNALWHLSGSGIDAWVADKGDYKVQIGASSKDIRLETSFKLPQDRIVEKVHDVAYPNYMLNELSRFE